MLAHGKWFSSLNLKCAYWLVALHLDDKEKTVFSAGHRLWQFMVMLFGLCNALAMFEQLMESVLSYLTCYTCLVYLNDGMVM
jgi:hypothetical protein